jgi:hypothetical protein
MLSFRFKNAFLAVSMLAVLLVGSSFAAWGQSVSGQITGSVTDPSDAAVAGASVVVTNTGTGVSVSAVTNSSGVYNVPALQVGTYDISITAAGFSKALLKGFSVVADRVAAANFKLRIAAAATNVVVESQAGAAIDTVSSQIENTFETKAISDLPVQASGLGVINLSLLAPGVGTSGGTGIGTGPSIGGQRPQNNDFTIEGIDNNDKTVSGPLLQVNPDSVAEFNLLTNVYSAEFGHSDAGHFNLTVRTGTNQFHGRAYEYFQNRNLDAVDTLNANSIPQKPRYDNNLFGGGVGGPILRDKLFFYADYEKNPIGSTGGTDQLCTPTAAGVTALNAATGLSATNLAQLLKYAPVGGSTTNNCATPTITVGNNNEVIALGDYNKSFGSYENKDFLTTAIDYHISEKDQIRGRYIYNLADGPDTAAVLPVFWGTAPNRYHLASISEFHTFTPNLLNEARLGYSRYFGKIDAPYPAEFPGLGTFPNIVLEDLNFLQIGPDPNAPSGGVQNTYELSDNVSYSKGKHSFKLGFDGRKYISPQYFTQRVRGDYDYTNSELYLTDGVPDDGGERDATSTGAIPTDYGDATAFAGFVQDDWKVLETLTLNLGVRYEFQSVPWVTKQQGLDALASVPGLINFNVPQPQKKNFGPHFGFAYAPNSKTSVRGGFAIGFDQLRDNLAENTAPPDIAITEDVGTSTPTPFLASGALPAKTPPLTTAAERIAVSSSWSPNQHVPYSESWSLGIQRTLFDKYTAEVRYLGNHGVHLVTQDRINKQPVVTATNYLPTFTAAPGSGTIAGLSNTLAALNALNSAGGSFVPAFYAAGFQANVVSYDYNGMSNYNGLQGHLTRQFQNGFMLDAAYTWSKTMDNSTDDVFATYLTPRRSQNSRNWSADYARSALDHTHRFTAAVVYDMPFFKNSGFATRNVLGNWEFSPIYTYESPEYATPQSGQDSNMNGDSAGDRTVINSSGNKHQSSNVTAVKNTGGDTVGYVATNPNAYYIRAGIGALATGSRNTMPANPINNFDLTAIKRITFADHYSFEFQAQAFNVLNHAQFTPGAVDNAGTTAATGSGPEAFVTANGGSQFDNASYAFSSHPRNLQLVAKFTF